MSRKRVKGVIVVIIGAYGGDGVRGGRAPFNGPPGRNGRFMAGRPAQGGNRVCRYFLAGECLRADCRFRSVLGMPVCYIYLPVVVVTTWRGPYVGSGCAGLVQRERRASFCTTFLRTLTLPGLDKPCLALTLVTDSKSTNKALLTRSSRL